MGAGSAAHPDVGQTPAAGRQRSGLAAARRRRLAALKDLVEGLDDDDVAVIERAVTALEPLVDA